MSEFWESDKFHSETCPDMRRYPGTFSLCKTLLIGLLLFFSSFLLLFSQNNSLTINISEASAKAGIIVIALFDNSDDWLENKKEFRILKTPATSSDVTVNISDLPTGDYAVAIYQDENANGKCDKNLIGSPTEKIGFSNNIKPLLRKPSFEKCRFELPATKSICIKLIKI